MAPPVIHRLRDLEAVSRKAAEIFVDLSGSAIQANGIFTVALSGGSTPRRLYELLATDEFRNQIQWQKVEFFWGDERCVPPGHEQSNFRLAYDSFLIHLALPDTSVHRIKCEFDPGKAARSYEVEMRSAFGTKGLPKFDLVMLGVGADGHTASLFPGSNALIESKRLAVAVLDREPPRVTLTLPVINAASNVMFLASGMDKQTVVDDILSGTGTYPAGLVSRERAVWLLGEES
jgi:6-phosphogluconolactonase